MKTLLLEVEDNTYQLVLDFIKKLPENCCRVLEDDTLSKEEQRHIEKCLIQIQQGDYSDFVDWDAVKHQL